MEYAQAEQKEAIRALQKWINPGATVYTVLARVSPSGMYRHLKFLIVLDNEIRDITYQVAHILGLKLHSDGAGVRGCGLDVGYHSVTSLSSKLYIDLRGNHDPAYALKHTWL